MEERAEMLVWSLWAAFFLVVAISMWPLLSETYEKIGSEFVAIEPAPFEVTGEIEQVRKMYQKNKLEMYIMIEGEEYKFPSRFNELEYIYKGSHITASGNRGTVFRLEVME